MASRGMALCLCALAALAGCTDTTGGGSSRCALNSDCPLPEVCVDERCVIECRITADCPAGEQCEDSICVDPLADCLSDADCRPFGLVCELGLRRCVAEMADMRVLTRDTSLPELDAERPDMRPPQPPVDAGPRPDARPPRDAAPPPIDATPPPIDAAPPIRGDARYGDPCRCGADCQSGLCLQNPYNDFAGQCSARCGAGQPQPTCPGIDRCVRSLAPGPAPGCPDPGLGLGEGDIIEVCAPNETGIPCRGPADCIIDGTCITPPDPFSGRGATVQAVCGARCDGDQGCPTGFRCQAIPTQGGGRVNVCAAASAVSICPDGSNGTCGGVCPLAAGVDPLVVSHCLVAPGLENGPGLCSCTCRNVGDCPVGFACSRGLIAHDDPSRPGMCLPIAGYNCPQGDAACYSEICAPPQGQDPFDRCTAPCNGPGDCPQGYGCQRPPGAGFDVCVVQ